MVMDSKSEIRMTGLALPECANEPKKWVAN
jgi:hypothetical protein